MTPAFYNPAGQTLRKCTVVGKIAGTDCTEVIHSGWTVPHVVENHRLYTPEQVINLGNGKSRDRWAFREGIYREFSV